MKECVPAVCVVLSKERTVAVTPQVFGNIILANVCDPADKTGLKQ